MQTTIHTKRDTFQDNETYIHEKQKLFHHLTSRMIINELKKYDIVISKQDIIHTYKSCYNIDSVIDQFDKKYDKQLDQLGERNEVFDDDALVYLILKVVEDNFDIHHIPDKAYIARDIQEMIYQPATYEQLLECTLHILKRIIALKQYENQSQLSVIFAPYMLDVDHIFMQIFEEINQHQIKQDLLKTIAHTLYELSQKYTLSYCFADIRINTLSALAKYGKSDDLDMGIQQFRQDYPDRIFDLYYAVLSQLSQTDHQQILQYYLHEVIQYMPTNEEQKDMLEIIQDSFQYV